MSNPPDTKTDRAEPRNIGQNDARLTETVSNVVEKVADAISHKLHPMIEQYAKLFKEGARTPVLKRPSDYGMEYETLSSRHSMAYLWKRGSSRQTLTNC